MWGLYYFSQNVLKAVLDTWKQAIWKKINCQLFLKIVSVFKQKCPSLAGLSFLNVTIYCFVTYDNRWGVCSVGWTKQAIWRRHFGLWENCDEHFSQNVDIIWVYQARYLYSKSLIGASIKWSTDQLEMKIMISSPTWQYREMRLELVLQIFTIMILPIVFSWFYYKLHCSCSAKKSLH